MLQYWISNNCCVYAMTWGMQLLINWSFFILEILVKMGIQRNKFDNEVVF